MTKRVIISLHDVTPGHLSRIKKAEQLLRDLKINKVSFFLVPDFHRQNLHGDPKISSAFRKWLSGRKNLNIEWVLHGYYHLEVPPQHGANRSFGSRLKNKLMTDKEAEFQWLGPAEIRQRLLKGREFMKQCIGRDPKMFVPPAWLYNKNLIPQLIEQGFALTEDYHSVYLLKQNRALKIPVITWATRTAIRRFIAYSGCPILQKFFRYRDIIRVALHPHDFDHPLIQGNIEGVLKRLIGYRSIIHYRDLL